MRPLLFAFITLFSLPSLAQFSDLDQIARDLRLDSYKTAKPARTVKIAVLDNGFRGHEAEIGKTLPASTKFHAGPIPVDAAAEEAHGLFMAQIVAGLLAKTPQISYELHLFSAFGYSNLEHAVQAVIAGQFDVVLYSQVWEYGGNGDGKGFINTLISRAASARPLIWVNAAGNFADATYRAQVTTAEDSWARLPGPNNSVRVRCLPNAKGKCQLRAILSWNDFKDDVSAGTDKDLDLVLSDDTLKVLRTSGLQQVKQMPTPSQPGLSLYPREILQAELTPGLYLLRTKVRSTNFSGGDALKIHASGDFIQQVDANGGAETLLPPSDNGEVITVGASDSQKSSASRAQNKPELLTRSLLTLSTGGSYKGSSNSAAVTAAVVALVKAVKPELDRTAVLALLRGEIGSPTGFGLPLEALDFAPTGAGCFLTAALPSFPPSASEFFRAGAVSVASTAGFKIMTQQDPFSMAGHERTQPNDVLVAGPQGLSVLPRSSQRMLPPGSYEVVQLPKAQSLCSFAGPTPRPSGAAGSTLRLPPLGALGQ